MITFDEMSERVCDVCGKQTFGRAYLAIDPRKAQKRPTCWSYGHGDCLSPTLDYSIAESQIATPAQVQEWTQHVSRKGWFTNTDWEAMLRRLGFNEGKDYRPTKGG